MSLRILVLGGTGRTGRRVVEQLLGRGVQVRAVVRSAERLPSSARGATGLEVVEGDLLAMDEARIRGLVQGCDAVVSCLGHNITLRGLYGRPRDLVAGSIEKVSRAIQALRPDAPVKLVLMSSVAVNREKGREAGRGWSEAALLALLGSLVPPGKDNQRAADFLRTQIGTADQALEWVAIRPDTLLEGEVTGYSVHEGLVSSIFRPDSTNRANVAHFMCDLLTDPVAWQTWKYGYPVIVNGGQA